VDVKAARHVTDLCLCSAGPPRPGMMPAPHMGGPPMMPMMGPPPPGMMPVGPGKSGNWEVSVKTAVLRGLQDVWVPFSVSLGSREL